MKTGYLFIICILSFSGSTKDPDIGYHIDLISNPKTAIISISEIVTSVDFIPLETVDNSMINRIMDIKRMNTRFYILQPWSITCFDKNGKFLYSLNKKGRGPGEYLLIKDFDISPVNNTLAILDSKQILLYSESGKGFDFLNSIPLSDSPPSKLIFIPGQNNLLLSYPTPSGNEPVQDVIISPEGKILFERSNYYKYERITNVMTGNNFINLQFVNNKNICFKFWLCDTVFTLDQSFNVKPYILFDTKGKHLTTNALADFRASEFYKYMVINLIMEVPRYIFYRYAYNKERYSEIYDKVANQKISRITIVAGQAKWLTDDISGGVDIEPKVCNDGDILSWVDAITLKKHVASIEFKNSNTKQPEKKKDLQEIVEKLEDTDNPVLVVLTPKR